MYYKVVLELELNAESKLEAVYQGVVTFIKWYNSCKKE